MSPGKVRAFSLRGEKMDQRRQSGSGTASYANIPYVNMILIAVNVVIFVAGIFLEPFGAGAESMFLKGALYAPLILKGQGFYRLVTSIFLHADASHLVNNMIMQFAGGEIVERNMGHARYLLLYFFSGIGGNLASVLSDYMSRSYGYSIGASGAVFGVTGALLYMTVFVPQFGVRGIWISVFNSVSAFCNAGIDIISENSLCDYSRNVVVNAVTSALVILGGLGYIVWWDVIKALGRLKSRGLRCFSELTLHSKLVLSITFALLLAGTAAFFIFEYNNPLTIRDYSLPEKLQASFFQSVTTRTAGFATIPQKDITNASAVFSLLLMFIGGSPVGTAGGVKTVTIAVVVFSALAAIRNKDGVSLFHRSIPKPAISKAAAVVCTSFMIMFLSTVLLSAVTDASVIDIAYETVSATATVGLTRDLTPTLNIAGKIIIIVTMYLGRVGPISLLVAFKTKKDSMNIIKDPTEDISIG